MKKILTLATALATSAMAAESLGDAFAEAKVSGQVRSFYIDRTFNGGLTTTRNALAIGGNLGVTTGEVAGLSMGVRYYSTEQLHWFEKSSIDPSLFGSGLASYSVLGEAFLQYKAGKTAVKYGKQKINTPLAGSDDARMLPNLFNGVVVSNSSVENLTIIGAHLTDMAVGSFGNVYGAAGSQLSLISGYGLGFQLGTSGKFASMSNIALGSTVNTLGVSALAAVYNAGGLKVQAWDYFAYDILNALYADASYSLDLGGAKVTAAAQVIQESGVGSNALNTKVNSLYYAGKLAVSAGMVSGYVALSQTGTDTSTTTNGGIISPWGGMPAYTQGMVTRHQFYAGTEAAKVALVVKPMDDLKVVGYYAYFHVSADNAYDSKAYDSTEPGFDVIYQATKKLQLRARGNFASNFYYKNSLLTGWNEYRLIMNYNF